MNFITNSCGIGLRSPHYHEIIETTASANWLEIHSENFFNNNSYLHKILDDITTKYALSFHSVNLSLGSTDDINLLHLKKIKELTDRYNPALISDHLAWSSVEGIYLHDLLPLPYNAETLNLLSNRIDFVQNFLGRQILIENPSSYLSFSNSTIKEVDFLNELSLKTKCGILLDINNLYISCHNLKMCDKDYLDNINASDVIEIHLAGFEHTFTGDIIIDTHSHPPSIEVLELFEYFMKKYGARPTLFEQDQNLTSLADILKQAKQIDEIIDQFK